MTAKFLGRSNGVVITCNHATTPYKDAEGRNAFHYGEACEARSVTGNILRSVNRKHAVSLGWFTATIAGHVRDFCPVHGPWWIAYLAQAEQAAADLKKRRAAKEARRREDREAQLAEWKRKREERAARSAARRAVSP